MSRAHARPSSSTPFPPISEPAHAELGDQIDSDALAFQVHAGDLDAFHRSGDVHISVAVVPHDPVLHRFLRIQLTDSFVAWLTSPTADGPFTLLGTSAETTVDPAISGVSIGTVAVEPREGGGSVIEWDSFCLLVPAP